MEPLHVFFFQFGMSHLVLACVALWFVWPHVLRVPPERAATWLIAPFLFRHVGATTLVVGVVSAEYSRTAAWIVTIGDTASVLLALAAIALLRRGSRLAWPAVWVFSLENIGYSLALVITEGFGALVDGIGAHWYIGTFYVPLMLVSQALLFLVITRRSRWPTPAPVRESPERLTT